MKLRILFRTIPKALVTTLLFSIPINASVIQGPIINPENRHLYFLLSQNTWTRSEQEALQLGGHLATIRNASEQSWVFQNFGLGFGGGRLLWIGLNDLGSEGIFKWSSGETNSDCFWAPGEPNNAGGNESYVALYYAGHDAQGLWNDWPDISSDPIGVPFMGLAEVVPEYFTIPLHNPVLVDFENLSGMNFNPQPVPDASRLSNQMQFEFGLLFQSNDPSVAVVDLGQGHATSGINGIGGIESGLLNYSAPVSIIFSTPGYPQVPATTDFVSIRTDLLGGGPPITMTAFGLAGDILGSTEVNDLGGTALALAFPGIHKLVIQPNGSSALDDLFFNQLIPSMTIIDFEGPLGMDFVAGYPVSAGARLTNQYAPHGALFSSMAGYAAILNLGPGHATSGTNGLGGTTFEGLLAYDDSAPIDIIFVNPTNSTAPAITDYFSVRVDRTHTLGTGFFRLEAYNLFDEVINSHIFMDSEDLAELSASGIHRVRMTGSGTTAFDDIVFNPVLLASPELRLRPDGSQFLISWSALFPGYILESASDLSSPVTWNPVQQSIEQFGSILVLSISPDATHRFYRLQL